MTTSDEANAPGTHRPIIYVCADGPLLVRGAIELIDSAGEPVRNERKTIALCRCGASTIKPFCDGSHKLLRLHVEPSNVE